MKSILKPFFLISFFGAIMSASGAVYTSFYYLSKTQDLEVTALELGHDVMDKKIEEMLENHDSKDIVMIELQARHRQTESLKDVLSKTTEVERVNAFWIAIFMYIITGIFCMLIIILMKGSKKSDQ